ncbi:MAG: hypothetical protein HFE63_03930 [Clostridiales bacterium]|nr:hypothetical protein [Clostridiales bacterium]
MKNKIKIGIVAERRWLADQRTRKGIFQPSYAVDNKNHVLEYIKQNFANDNTEFTDLEWLNEEGLLFENDDVERVVDYLTAEKVDALFIINCNFGNEDAAGRVARMMKLPVLLWGPRDNLFTPEGNRFTDSQCGLFAISEQLHRSHIPFTYIENCNVEDKPFADGLSKFLSVVSMLKGFKGMRVVQVGVRVKPFKSVMYNEMELLEKFGIDVIPVNMAEAVDKLNRIYETRRPELEALAAETKKKMDTSSVEDEMLVKMMTFVPFYKEIYEENHATVISTECWTSMNLGFGAMPCLAMSILADMGYLVTCESDVYGAITMALMYAMKRGESVPCFGEFTCRNPQNDDSELLWHCGPFAYSLKKPGVDAYIFNFKPSFRVADGDWTIGRFQGQGGNFKFLGGDFKTAEGPHTFGTYMWADFGNLPKVERKVIEGPYIHHMAEIQGHYADVIKEFCKYVPELEFDDLYN